MKLITTAIPESFLEEIKKMSSCTGLNRSEILRMAIRDLIIAEFADLDKEQERKNKTRIFDYCLNCDEKLAYFGGGHFTFDQDYKILGLRFCNNCYMDFKERSLQDLPAYLIVKIERKLKAYKAYRKASDDNKFSIKEKKVVRKLEKELKRINKAHIFNYCIVCDKNLKNLAEKNQDYEIFGLKFCLSCYEKFKDKTWLNFPQHLIIEIEKKFKIYNAYREKSKKITIKGSKIAKKGRMYAQKLEEALEKLRIMHFFDYCINCGARLHTTGEKNHYFHKNFEIFELKFCCSCYRKFKDKSFNEFPRYLINRINKNIKAYKTYLRNKNQK